VIRRNGQVKIFREECGALLDITPSSYTVPTETPQDYFVRAILKGEPVAAPGEHGLEVMRILDAIYASAGKGGREVRMK
jgi:predicted dehydrogenase